MSWETLRPVLLELSERDPSPVAGGPDPRVTGPRRLPVHVALHPWAEAVAARLHATFGDEITLVVGNFGFPERVWMDRMGRRVDPPGTTPVSGEPVDPSVVLLELRHDVVVRSGHRGEAELVIANRSPATLEFRRPTATVADLETGDTVGGRRRARRPTGERFELSSGRTGSVRFWFETASDQPALGYAVPPGDWAVRVVLPLTDGRSLRAPLLPIRVV